MNRLRYLVMLLLWLPAMAYAKVTEYQFDNGLKLIVKEDHRAPVVVSQVWYKVGSSYEQNGNTGLSHMLEHMMFKGTKTLKPTEFSKIIAENGGDQNAFTGRDYTAYFQTLHKDRLEVSFRLESDRMRNLIIDAAELVKERDVVAEERRMRTEDSPHAVLRERFNATAFMSSPYHHPVIGWMSDIQHYEVADLAAWYQKWYAPNNATIVVVGDVDPDAVKALADKYFAPLEPEQIAVVKPQIEPEQKGMKQIKVKMPAQLPYLMMGWKIPVLNTVEKESDWEPYALEVLAAVLDGDNSARFAKELVREQRVATSVGAGSSLTSRMDDLFIIAGTPAQDRSVLDLKEAIEAQIETVKTTLVSTAELERVKAQVVASDVYERDSVFYQAMQIGMLETVGLGWEVSEQYVEKVKAVTPEQIQEVAKKYLVEDRLTVGELVPLPIETGQVTQSAVGGHHVH